ncbi:phosphatidate cytidylyltransferase [Psychrobacter urativorans]|nr:phosphatidate cytidylyltransferase [Psychrobacter urativorans]
MTLNPDHIFIISILSINILVWIVLSIPKNRKKLPSIYLITRSWWWMLALLFGCYLLAQITNAFGDYIYWWVLDGLFIVIGLQGLYEIFRLWRLPSKNKLLQKLAAQQSSQINAHNSASSLNVSNLSLLSVSHRGILDIGLLMLLVCLIISLLALHHLSFNRSMDGVLLFVLFASQFNDISQYLCGRLLGGRLFQRKLAPRVSPNKTIEGALFGSLLSASLATILGILVTPFSWVTSFAFAILLAVSGIMGDLLESAFKRHHGIKDTGTILPGHGGILDRIDSLLIGVPLFTVIYWLMY